MFSPISEIFVFFPSILNILISEIESFKTKLSVVEAVEDIHAMGLLPFCAVRWPELPCL